MADKGLVETKAIASLCDQLEQALSLSPQSQLPPEILAEIFIHTLPQASDSGWECYWDREDASPADDIDISSGAASPSNDVSSLASGSLSFGSTAFGDLEGANATGRGAGGREGRGSFSVADSLGASPSYRPRASGFFSSSNPPETGEGLPSVSRTSTLLAITHVSTSWRNIAIRTPELWNRMCFEYTYFDSASSVPSDLHAHAYASAFPVYPENPFRVVGAAGSNNGVRGRERPESDREVDPRSNLLRLWMERSHPLPIHLALTPRYALLPSTPLHPSTLAVLTAHSNRIRTLAIDAPVKTVLQPLFSPFAGEEVAFGALEGLSIKANLVDSVSVAQPIRGFEACPMLRRVSLDLAPAQPGVLAIDWGKITHLDMLNARAPVNRGRWIHLVRACPKLVVGRFWVTSQSDYMHLAPPPSSTFLTDGNATLSTPFAMDDLVELVIEYRGSDSLSSLFHNLSFGKLRNLEVRCEPGERFFHDRMNLGSWNKLVGRFGRGLRRLVLTGLGCSVDNLLLFLRTLDALEELKLDIPNLEDDRLVGAFCVRRAQTPGSSESPLLPHLRRLWFRVNRFDSDSSRVYRDVVQTRVALAEGRDGVGCFYLILHFDRAKWYGRSIDLVDHLGLDDDAYGYLRAHVVIRHVSAYERL
ncbi:hypothetical protein CC1G_09632 [Coprinopsis cinerea okayama7|uniref:Uncharacterized protein n=1 Tax=Coprinopsis cinerea (strain Okayama-7 / 130 / ATCC MYA-4618 / FGSC 9003) TaxID=240176 RepID=A8N4E8_COPC7|nr:hypothetical protein CC1G_09632 [Coprinopsis cinerea okayama7\|eukprot:XP_001829743.1 hypothetical protein CC1G_09632 [Coprinopsis cinerea okayama7\